MKRAKKEEEEEIQLMLKVKQNHDDNAFDQLYQRYKHRIQSFFRYKLIRFHQSVYLAEDYTQEVFIRLNKNASHYEPDGKFSSYIFKIARNFWINEQKRIHRRPRTIPIDELNKEQKQELIFSLTKDHPSSPAENLIIKEKKKKLRRIIETLPQKQGQVLILRFYEKLSDREIAEKLETPLTTIKSRRTKGLENLKAKLGNHIYVNKCNEIKHIIRKTGGKEKTGGNEQIGKPPKINRLEIGAKKSFRKTAKK